MMSQRASFREDIQGVRAIGIALIVIFHIWFAKVSGGVDVLFVISGYLMTQSLMRVEGGVVPAALRFWSGVVIRILPTAFLIIAIVVLWANTLGPPQERLGISDHALATLFQVENIYLKFAAADYLARDNPPSPLQHFWALSVQMQFFAVLPLLVVTALWLKRQFGLIAALALPVLIAILSFAYALEAISNYAAGAYFDPRGRMWEFMAGLALAFIPLRAQIPASTRTILSWVGLGLIVSCGFMPRDWAFPGPVALIPVSGAILILISGTGVDAPRAAANRFLAWNPLAGVGRYAFTIYLWHWPILVYAMHATGETILGFWSGLGVIGLSLGLAWSTYRVFEMPLRARMRRRLEKLPRTGFRSATPLLGFLAVAVFFSLPIGLRDRQLQASVADYVAYNTGTGNSADYFGTGALWVPSMSLQLMAAREINPVSYIDGCHVDLFQSEVRLCEYGRPEASYTIAVVGGSHSAQWLPALRLVAERLPIRVLAATKSACLLGGGSAIEGDRASCEAWNANLLERLAEIRPNAVFTTSTVAIWEKPDFVPESYPAVWRKLNDMGINVIAIRDNPRPVRDAPSCVARAQIFPANCAEPRTSVLAPADPGAVPWGPGVYTFDLGDTICDAEACPYARDGRLLYRDRSHLSVPYVRELAPRIETAVQAAIEHFKTSDRPGRLKSAEN